MPMTDSRLLSGSALLRQSLPAEIHLHYAMKANPMPAVVQHMAGLVDGIDVASAAEMRVALDTPMAARAYQLCRTREDRRRSFPARLRPGWS